MENFITKIYIKKIRHLEDFEINLWEDKMRHLIITGKNGSGKTSLYHSLIRQKIFSLQRLINSYLILISNMEEKISILNKNPRENNNQTSINNNQKSIDNYNNVIKILERQLNNIQQNDFIQDEELLIYFKNNSFDNLLNINFETNRQLHVNKSTWSKDKISNSAIDFEKRLAAMKTDLAYLTFEKWSENKIKQISERFDVFFANFLKDVFEDDSISLEYNRENDKLDFYLKSNNRDKFDFNTLSSWYGSILYIIFEILQKVWTENSFDYKKSWIVIIDELDAHLHISLQKKILPLLTDMFPNIQFIVTTHSPFIINSIDNAVICDLEKRIVVEDMSWYSSEDVLEDYFELDKYSLIIKSKLKEYKELIKKWWNKKRIEQLNDDLESVIERWNIELEINKQRIDLWLK